MGAQLDRVRADLADALKQEEQVAVTRQVPHSVSSCRTRSRSSGTPSIGCLRFFCRRHEDACAQIRVSLVARQAALTTTVARLLVENNASEEQTAQRIEGIYGSVEPGTSSSRRRSRRSSSRASR